MALVALISAMLKHVKISGWVGVCSGILASYTFFQLYTRINQIKNDMNTQLRGNPFKGLADAMFQSAQLEFGWCIMLIGICMLIYAGFFC